MFKRMIHAVITSRRNTTPVSTARLPDVLAMPNPGLYSVDAAPRIPSLPIIPGGPPQGAGNEYRQDVPQFDRGDTSLEGPWRSFFAGAVRPDIQHL